jgi:hypothetical protein
MCCSDYLHSEGTASPLANYAAFGLADQAVVDDLHGDRRRAVAPASI